MILAVADGGPPADNPPPDDVFDGIFGEATPMLVARSTDPVAINDDDPSDECTSFHPQLDVAPNGRVDVV